MSEQDWLAKRFEESRGHLRAVAYRMVGSLSEAEDAVQETWLRLNRSDVSVVENLEGWMTTVVARICLDMLRARKARREEAVETEFSAAAFKSKSADPEGEAMLADSIGIALLVVLEQLAPAERLAFVLHDMFDLSFDEIAPIVNRSAAATRQLASRARRRIQGPKSVSPDATSLRIKQKVVSAFLEASRTRNLEGLLAVLDPQVSFRPDAAALKIGASAPMDGARNIATAFNGRARGAYPILINGEMGVVVAPGGHLRLAIQLGFKNGKIADIRAIAEPAELQKLEFALADGGEGM